MAKTLKDIKTHHTNISTMLTDYINVKPSVDRSERSYHVVCLTAKPVSLK